MEDRVYLVNNFKMLKNILKQFFHLHKFARKSEAQYPVNFFMSLFLVIINDGLFFFIFYLFLNYFKNWFLKWQDFLLSWWIFTFWYGILVWVFSNLYKLNNIIENWKLDYYLSFPISPLVLLISTKIEVEALWDILFSLVSLGFYFYLTGFSFWIFLKVIIVLFIASLFVIWLSLIVWSISFWQDRASLWINYIWHVYWTLWSYPYKIFTKNLLILFFSILVLLFPSWILAQILIVRWGFGILDLIFIVFCISVFIFWLWLFNRWLKRYSSGNLVLTNV